MQPTRGRWERRGEDRQRRIKKTVALAIKRAVQGSIIIA